MTLALEGGLLVAAGLLALPLEKHFWDGASFSTAAVATGILVGVILIALVLAFVESPVRITSTIRRDVDNIVGLFQQATLFDLLLVSVLAGVCEEAFFRGFLQLLLLEHLGTATAVLLASVVFGLLHWVSPAYALFATILGLGFGCLYVLTDNIVIPMVAHAAYDFVALLYAMRFRQRRN